MHLIELFKRGDRGFQESLEQLEQQDAVAASMVRVRTLIMLSSLEEAIRTGTDLLKDVSDKPDLSCLLFTWLGIAYRGIGQLETSDNYFIRSSEVSEYTGNQEILMLNRLQLLLNKFYRAEYGSLYGELKKALPAVRASIPKQEPYVLSLLATIEIIKGNPDKAYAISQILPEHDTSGRLKPSLMECKALSMRMVGQIDQAISTYHRLAEYLMETGSKYAVSPCADAALLQVLRDKSFSREMAEVCLKTSLSNGETREISGDIMVIQGLLNKEAETWPCVLLEASKRHLHLFQQHKAFLVGLASAYLGWQFNSSAMAKGLKFIAPLAPLHPGFKKDPLLGEFFVNTEGLMQSIDRDTRQRKHRVSAKLMGQFRVWVDGKEIFPLKWRSRKAALAVIYLLLSKNHKMAKDHLFYLLWPKRKFQAQEKHLLYEVISIARRNLGDSDLIKKKWDFYFLEDARTDLEEIEELVRYNSPLGGEPDTDIQRRELLGNLIQEELLPDIEGDRFVDEVRQYYQRMRKRISTWPTNDKE